MSEFNPQSALFDDHFTYLEGPLQRLFRMRKWFFLSGLTLLLLDSTWLDYGAFAEAVFLEDLPKDLLRFAVTITLLYLFVQFSLLLLQAGLSYRRDLALRTKLVVSGTAEMLKHQKALQQATISVTETELRASEERRRGWSSGSPAGDGTGWQEARGPSEPFAKLKQDVAFFASRVTDAEPPPPQSPRLDALRERMAETETDLAQVYKVSNFEMATVRFTELILDVMRLAPTPIFGLYALVRHGVLVI